MYLDWYIAQTFLVNFKRILKFFLRNNFQNLFYCYILDIVKPSFNANDFRNQFIQIRRVTKTKRIWSCRIGKRKDLANEMSCQKGQRNEWIQDGNFNLVNCAKPHWVNICSVSSGDEFRDEFNGENQTKFAVSWKIFLHCFLSEKNESNYYRIANKIRKALVFDAWQLMMSTKQW